VAADLTEKEIVRLAQDLVREGWRDAFKKMLGPGARRRGRPPAMPEPEETPGAPPPEETPPPEDGVTPPPPEDEVTPPPPEDEDKPAIPKETPLSLTKVQPQLKVGPGKNPQQQRAGGQKEAPLVGQLQKIGMSQQSAQQIAKRIAQYLQQRKIPVAEGVQYLLDKGFLQSAMTLLEANRLEEATDISRLKSSIFGSLRNITAPKASDATKAKGAEYVLGLHGVANQPDPEKFRKFLRKRFSGWHETLDTIAPEELKQLMDYIKTSPQFEKYHKAGFELRQAKAAGKAQRRGDIRGVGKGVNKAADTIIGKIISRFVSDNQQLLDKDPALQGIFDDPKKFNKLRKSVTNLLARQMQRRGYDAAEIEKIIGKKPPENMGEAHEELVAECVREMQNILSTTTKLSRWKVLSGVR
tara:strand:+ start:433 stop:1668 length:1236 start_codon:yes stop_codon:yes gene_type:complete